MELTATTTTPSCGGLAAVGLLLVVAQSVVVAMAHQQPAVHFEPPVALRGGLGLPQATSTNTMGLL